MNAMPLKLNLSTLRSHKIKNADLYKFSMKLLSALSLILLASILNFSVSAQTTFENPPFAVGNINQNGWYNLGTAGTGCGANYDHVIYANSGNPPSFGAQSLRISNAVTTGCFDQTFSASLANEAGELSAVSNGNSGGNRKTHFEYQFDIASAVPNAQQPGMIMSVAPDRGDGARMSYLRFEDQAALPIKYQFSVSLQAFAK